MAQLTILAANASATMRIQPFPAQRCRRHGTTLVELLVSAFLLISVMSFVTTWCFHINTIWKDIGHHRVALCELSNQLEVLTRLNPTQAQEAIDAIEPSSTCARTLKNPELTGNLVEDALGTRVVLQLNWQRRYPGKPVTLAGWLPRPTEATDDVAAGGDQ